MRAKASPPKVSSKNPPRPLALSRARANAVGLLVRQASFKPTSLKIGQPGLHTGADLRVLSVHGQVIALVALPGLPTEALRVAGIQCIKPGCICT